jgi:preprotein translocase subunit YajC
VEGQASSLIFLVFLVAIFYFMLIRPQRRRVQQHRSLIDSLNVGDEIVTIGGLFGTIKRLGDEDLDLQVDSTTTVRLVKTAVARVVADEAPTEEPA